MRDIFRASEQWFLKLCCFNHMSHLALMITWGLILETANFITVAHLAGHICIQRSEKLSSYFKVLFKLDPDKTPKVTVVH